MEYKIENCKEGDADYIIDRLVEYNLSQVPARQEVLFDTLDKMITDDNGKIIAGCVARMYCWNIAYIDTLWVDEPYHGNRQIKHRIELCPVNVRKYKQKRSVRL